MTAPDSILPGDSEQDSVFVEEYVKTGDAMLAIVRSGIRDPAYSMDIVARRTLERPEIAAAVKALERIERASLPVEITRESLVADMQQVYEKCISIGDHKSAISAKKLQATLCGLLDQKITVTHRHLNEMTDADLMRIASKGKTVTDADYEEIPGDPA